MNIEEYPRTKTRDHRIIMVQVTVSEALGLIESLAHQIATKNPNSGRMETFCKDGTDFSIAVHPDPPKRKSTNLIPLSPSGNSDRSVKVPCADCNKKHGIFTMLVDDSVDDMSKRYVCGSCSTKRWSQ